MKRLRYFLSTLAVILVFGGNVFGQTNTITASADVVSEITSSGTLDLRFAAIADNLSEEANEPSVSPTDGSSSNIVNGTPQVGRLVLKGTGSSSISVTYSKSNLVNINEEDNTEITFTPDVVGKAGDGSSAGTANGLTEGGAQVTITTGASDGANFITDGDGYFTIWVGGSLSSDGSIPSGRYEGTQTFTITYL